MLIDKTTKCEVIILSYLKYDKVLVHSEENGKRINNDGHPCPEEYITHIDDIEIVVTSVDSDPLCQPS